MSSERDRKYTYYVVLACQVRKMCQGLEEKQRSTLDVMGDIFFEEIVLYVSFSWGSACARDIFSWNKKM